MRPPRVDNRWRILSTVSVGTFMATLDGSIVNIALPSIQAAFAIDLATVEWVVIGYLLAVGSLLLPFGRLGEVLTFRRVYLVGFGLFTVASALCGAAPGATALIAFRILQGAGAAMLQAMGPAIVARTFGPGERGRALGINAISVALGLTLGPALGGVLTEVASWRAVFLVNIPVGVFAIVWAMRTLPAERSRGDQAFDVPGAALSSAALTALLLALVQGQSWGWTSPAVGVLLAVAAGSAVAFVRVERRAVQPLIDLGLFRIRAFAAGNASVVIAFSALFTATFLLPFLLQVAEGFSPAVAGILLTPVPIMTAVVAPFSGSLSDRIGSRLPASLGIAIMAAGLFTLAGLDPDFAPVDLVWRLALVGLGQGLFMSPNSSAVLGSVPRPRIGTASGTLAQMRVVGQALGIAASGAIVAVRVPVHLATATGAGAADASSRAVALGIRDAFLVAGLVCCVGIATSLVRGAGRGADEAGGARGSLGADDAGDARAGPDAAVR